MKHKLIDQWVNIRIHWIVWSKVQEHIWWRENHHILLYIEYVSDNNIFVCFVFYVINVIKMFNVV